MFPVSDRYAAAIRKSHRVKFVADLWIGGRFTQSFAVSGGSISVDRTAAIRRQGTVVIADRSFVPLYADSALSPFIGELRITQSVSFMDSTTEDVPLGVFRIENVDWDDSEGAIPTVTFYDRSKALDDAKFMAPRDLSGRDAQTTITQLVQEVLDVQVMFDIALGSYTLPGGSTFDSDRLGAISTIAAGLGAEGSFDVFGNFVVVPVPSLSNPNYSTVLDAGPSGVLVAAKRGVTRTGIYNVVALQGVSTDGNGAPPMGFAADTDPRSPTYWGPLSALPNGPYERTPFGQVVYRTSNNVLTTPDQCRIAAEAQLQNLLGAARSVDFTAVPNYALDAGDVALMQFPGGKQGVHVIDKLTQPLGEGQFTGSTRTSTY